ncbi:MAG: hypothetical protein AABO57_13150 [Acidobacteriota bacterium]
MSLFIQGNPVLLEIERAMEGIGYRKDRNLLWREYEYTDVIGTRREVRTIDLAGFAQSPPSYRNACIGVIVSNGLSGAVHVAKYRALGAPLIFELDGPLVRRWKITAIGEPELKQEISLQEIGNVFRDYRTQWKPERILRAKAVGELDGPIQLDFYDEALMPFLEGRTFAVLDRLLHEVLTKTIRTYKRFNRQRAPRFEDLCRLAFRFITAKVFRDRRYPGGWSSNDAMTALRAVEKHYNTRPDELPASAIYRPEILDEIWRIFLAGFNFPNLSEDDLALLFEKTFITPEIRKTLGIHSTPLRVADYIVRKLPFETLPEGDRYVLEPFSGHGRFLVAAMRRMRDLLQTPMSDAERHDYFRRRLTGIEIDSFSLEVCRLSLMLADSPNSNGWRLRPSDVFASQTLQRELKRARIVLCNPPFEAFTPSKHKYYNDPDLLIHKPAELLRRVMSEPPDLLGLVLPRAFESGNSYRKFHRQLAETYGNIELVALPEVFNYSDVPTMLVIASDRHDHYAQVAITCRQVGEGEGRDAFLLRGIEPPPVRASVDITEYSQPQFSLWIPRLSRIWTFLEGLPRLASAVEVHRGLVPISSSPKSKKRPEDFVSNIAKRGYKEGFAHVHGHLMQYMLKRPSGSPKEHLSMRPEDQYDNAYKQKWDAPKVVCNAIRLSRSPWRLGAVADSVGLVFSQSYIGLWPSGRVSIYALAALLNSPLANAYVFAKDTSKHNRNKTLESLPLPPTPNLESGSLIDSLSRELHRLLLRGQFDKAKKAVLEIDAEILLAYDLPKTLERELLDTFQDYERPIPVKFGGYYPRDFDAYIPLHELISPEFEEARADRLVKRLVFVNDPEISEAMAMLRGESLDEELSP